MEAIPGGGVTANGNHSAETVPEIGTGGGILRCTKVTCRTLGVGRSAENLGAQTGGSSSGDRHGQPHCNGSILGAGLQPSARRFFEAHVARGGQCTVAKGLSSKLHRVLPGRRVTSYGCVAQGRWFRCGVDEKLRLDRFLNFFPDNLSD